VVTTASGRAVPEAVCSVLDTAGRQLGHGRTDAAGAFTFEAAGHADVVLVVRHPAHRPFACAVHLGEDSAEELPVDVQLLSGLRVTGVVRSLDGHQIPDARVALHDGAGAVIAATRTDEVGRYEFVDVDAGQYRLVASGYPVTGHDLTIDSGRDVQALLTLAHPDPVDA
jgi:uncharacterized protein YfaS (alpha-2-macroglobulin family)